MDDKDLTKDDQLESIINDTISSIDLSMEGLDYYNSASMASGTNTFSINDLNIGDITITAGGTGGGGYIGTTGPNTWNTTTAASINFGTDINWGGIKADTISSNSGKTVNVDDLADTLDTIKRRLLILTPNFELHEKYPMLKEMYDEYKAMERLLGGPDCSLDDQGK